MEMIIYIKQLYYYYIIRYFCRTAGCNSNAPTLVTTAWSITQITPGGDGLPGVSVGPIEEAFGIRCGTTALECEVQHRSLCVVL
jgi:hypothetical protein